MVKDGKHLDRNHTESSVTPQHDLQTPENLDREWLRSIFEHSPIPTNVFDLDGNIIAANEALIEFAGVSTFDDLKGFNLFDDPNLSSEMKERLRSEENIRYQSKIDFELVRELGTYPTKRTDIAYVETGMSVLRSPKTGEKIGYLVQLVDTSKRKKLEMKLQESQEKYRQISSEFEMIMDAIPALVFYKDRNGNYIHVNEFVADVHNMSKEEVIGKSTFDLYPESQAKAYRQKELEVMECGEPMRNITEPWITKQGTHWINTSIMPLRDDVGEIMGVVGISIDITERMKMEEELKRSEKQLRKVLESVPVGTILVDAKTKRIVEANTMVFEITGFSEDDIKGKICTRVLCSAEESECPILDQEQDIEKSEHMCHTKDGDRLPILKKVSRITLGGQEYLLESFIDISAEKRIEEELRASRERYRTLIEMLPAGVIIGNLNEEIELANPAMAEILGTDQDELIGKSLLDFVPQEFVSMIDTETRKRTKGIESTYEIQTVDSKGETKHLRISAAPRFDSKGNVTGSIGVGIDITERKEAERKLRQTTFELQERMKEMKALYLVTELSTDTDMPLDEALESVAQTVADAFQYPEITCTRIMVEGSEYKTASFEETIWNLDEDIWCEGEKIGLIEVCYLEILQEADIGPFLQEELNLLSSVAIQIGEYIELRRIQQRRMEQHRELELYASLLRHDLKNDLGAILGNIDILKMLLNNADEEINKTISSVEAVSERMNSLLTALSRPAESTSTDLYELIDRIANQTTKQEPQLTIDITADPDAEGARIPASRLLPMVFENLFRNSLDFIEEDPVITVKLSNENGTVEALVSDNGPGVADEIRDTLFERGSSTRGGGMGLYLSRQILEGLGGSIELVDASSHEGATFRVVLPSR